MPTAADAFVIVASVALIFFAVRLPALGDALGRLLPLRKRSAAPAAPRHENDTAANEFPPPQQQSRGVGAQPSKDR